MSQKERGPLREALVATVGLGLGILAFSPTELGQRLQEWAGLAGRVAGLLGLFLAGVAVAIVLQRMGLLGGSRSGSPQPPEFESSGEGLILTNDEFETKVHSILEADRPLVIKIFGYTGETVLNDVFRFDDRYRGNLEVRFLHRAWDVERSEEELHNGANPDLRPWDKASTIQALGTQRWSHPLRRQFRYYRHQPIIKGLIILDQRGRTRHAFVSFFHWMGRPEEGGSIYKGIGLPFIYLQDGSHDQSYFIDILESQFDYEWAAGVAASELPPLTN